MATIFQQEVVAGDFAAFGQSEHSAFKGVQTLEQLLELHDQLFDPVIVQVNLLNLRHQLQSQLLIVSFDLVGGFFTRHKRIETLALHLLQLLVERLNLIKLNKNIRLQLFFQSRQGKTASLPFGSIDFLCVFRIIRLVFAVLFAVLTLGRDAFRTVLLSLHGFKIDDIAEEHVADLEALMPGNNGTEGERTLTESADHLIAASLNALGDGDLALTGEKFDRPHFTQIHADRIIGATKVFADIAGSAFGPGLGFGLFFLGFLFLAFGCLFRRSLGFVVIFVFYDLDAHLGENGHDILDLLGRHLILGKNRIQLVERDVSTLPALGYQTFNSAGAGIEECIVPVLFT